MQNTIKLEEILTEDSEVKSEDQIAAFLRSKQGTQNHLFQKCLNFQ